MGVWNSLKNSRSYEAYSDPPANCLVVTATNDSYAQGAVGMIKSFLIKSNLKTDHVVLGRGLSDTNSEALLDLPRTRVKNLNYKLRPPDH